MAFCPNCGTDSAGKFCAKCGSIKDQSQNYVCDECVGSPGGFHFCAVCGQPWTGEAWNGSRDYVCVADLARPATGEGVPSTP